MPAYVFEHRDSKELENVFCSYTEAIERDRTTSWKLLPSSPKVVRSEGTLMGKISKNDGQFREVLQSIKKNNRGSKINI